MMKEMKLLAVGNSFSEDAFYDLHDLAEAGGILLKTVNLYIGGCPLKHHWENCRTGKKEYEYQLNGRQTKRVVSIEEVLKEEKWDMIMTQQASHESGLFETYFPYLKELILFFKEKCPDAQYFLHETWAYESDSDHSEFYRYHNSQQEMYERLKACYEKAAVQTGLKLIKSGQAVQELRKIPPFRYELGGRSLCRDGYHMDLIYGRYLLAAVLYTALFGKDILKNPFVPDGADEEILQVIKSSSIF